MKFCLALLGPITLASDVRYLTALRIEELTPEDGEESSKTRCREEKDAES